MDKAELRTNIVANLNESTETSTNFSVVDGRITEYKWIGRWEKAGELTIEEGLDKLRALQNRMKVRVTMIEDVLAADRIMKVEALENEVGVDYAIV